MIESKSFAKLLLNQETLEYLRNVTNTYKNLDLIRTQNIKNAIQEGGTEFKTTKFKEFKLKLKKNRLLFQNEVDIREEIKEIASGYPKFIEANINPPDIEIKRENMLLKLFQIKGISMYELYIIFLENEAIMRN